MDCALAVTRAMVKHCCAVGCHNVYEKESGVKFYRFPSEEVNGLLPSSVKTGNPMNIHGYAASILYQARRATIL